jgi:hypothetical protein
MAEMNLFGATSADVLTLMNASSETGFTLEDAGGEEAILQLMRQAEAWVLEALPEESARLLSEVEDEILCRWALGFETSWMLGGPGGIAGVEMDSVRLYRLGASAAEGFFASASGLSRQHFRQALAGWELDGERSFAVSQDPVTKLTEVTLLPEGTTAETGEALVASYRIETGAGFEEPGLARLLLTRTAADVARRLGYEKDWGRYEEESRRLSEGYGRMERIPWTRKRLDLVRDRGVSTDGARNQLRVGRCTRG